MDYINVLCQNQLFTPFGRSPQLAPQEYNRVYLAVANAFAQICSASLRKLRIHSERYTQLTSNKRKKGRII